MNFFSLFPFLPTELNTLLPSSSPALFFFADAQPDIQSNLSFSDSFLSIFPTKNKKAKTLRSVVPWEEGAGPCHWGERALSGIEVGQETGSSVYTTFTRRMVEYSAWKLGFLFKI